MAVFGKYQSASADQAKASIHLMFLRSVAGLFEIWRQRIKPPKHDPKMYKIYPLGLQKFITGKDVCAILTAFHVHYC